MLISSSTTYHVAHKAPRQSHATRTDSGDLSFGDRVDVALAGALPVVGAGMNLVYGGGMSLLAQKPSLGVLSLVGGVANLASLPLLASGNYLAAMGALAVSAATLEHVHRNW